MGVRWNNEIIKAKFTFDNGKTYEVSSYSENNDKFITDSRKVDTEQISYTNLYGSVSSNVLTLSIFDINNYLDIENQNSPYYGYMRNGAKCELFISYDNHKYENFGTYYVKSWSEMYRDGLHDICTIALVDELEYILNCDMPKLSAYSGVKAGDLIIKVLTGIGIKSSRIKIDKSLEINLLFGVTDDDKVGYFLNEICQALCAVIIIDKDNNILVVPALTGYGQVYELPDKYIESYETSNNQNNIYTKVKTRFAKRRGSRNGILLTDNIDVVAGENDFNSLSFSSKCLAVREIAVEDADIEINGFNAYQSAIDIDIDGNDNIENMDMTVSGEYMIAVEKSVSSDINYTDSKLNTSYNIVNNYVQTEAEAQIVADKLARYIELMSKRITIRTIYTPAITTGDVLIFEGANLYGRYKVIDTSTVFSEQYSKEITIIPLNTYGIWDDSKSWNDDLNWIENLALSQS